MSPCSLVLIFRYLSKWSRANFLVTKIWWQNLSTKFWWQKFWFILPYRTLSTLNYQSKMRGLSLAELVWRIFMVFVYDYYNISKVANVLARTMTQCSELSSTIIVSYRDSFFLQKTLKDAQIKFHKKSEKLKKLERFEQLEILKKRIWSLLVPTHLFIVRY